MTNSARLAAIGLAAICSGPLAAQPEVTPDSPSSPSIILICGGQGTANRATTTTGFVTDNNGNSAMGSVTGQRSVGFGDQVRIELPENGRARIRMPRAMLPTIRGGKDGWFWIDSIRKSDTEITGVVQANVFNSPKLRLDRISGHISISGKSGDYSGVCEPYDPTTIRQKF